MSLFFQEKELSELMQSFYLLTGIKIALFDKNCNEVASYPNNNITFCMHMRKNKEFDKKCRMCDGNYFRKCAETKELHIYKCHAGLHEAMMPIMKNSGIIGYMIFGQIHNNENKAEFEKEMEALVKEYGITENLKASIKKIRYKKHEQILAAATILRVCVEYIQIKEIVRSTDGHIMTRIEEFIDRHIDEELPVSRICDELGIKRTRLYELMSAHTGGIATYIKLRRLNAAKKLLAETDMSVPDISQAVGFADYNYFLRVFKKHFGVSTKAIRKQLY